MQGLTFVRDLTWTEVFEIWRGNEEHLEKWKEVYSRRGFETWEAWRKNLTATFELEKRTWKLYRVDNPTKSVPTFHGGPFRGWSERYYKNVSAPDFETLAKHPDVQTNNGVREIMEAFPASTTITGVQNDDGVVIVEGMHRCAAIALAAEEKRDIASELSIALADYQPGHLPLTGKRD